MSSLFVPTGCQGPSADLLTSKWARQETVFKAFPPGCARLTLLSPADGKIRLATLELSCLLLKQQVVTSTGCIIKDVHLACLEVRAPSHRLGSAGGRAWQGNCWIQMGAPGPGVCSTSEKQGLIALIPHCNPLVPVELPFL